MIRYSLIVDEATPNDPSKLGGTIYNLRIHHHAPNVTLTLKEIVDAIGRPFSPTEEDWLDLLIILYLTDQICHRGLNEQWNRRLDVVIPVTNVELFDSKRPLIQSLFGRMTHDTLNLQFVPRKSKRKQLYPGNQDVGSIDCVALLSGGLDSATGSVHVIESYGRPCFVSARGSGHVIHSQRRVLEELAKGYGSHFVTAGFAASPDRKHPSAPLPPTPEPSQRSRTMYFLGVAAIVAMAHDLNEMVLAENGVMAINCPLTAGRMAGFSTHTAHPDVLNLIGQLITEIFDVPFRIANPYVHKTKTEVVSDLGKSNISSVIPDTHSCWIARTASHCGTCVPCIVRRFSTEAAGIVDVTYDIDIFASAQAGDDKATNLVDYMMFISQLELLSDDELLMDFPEMSVTGGPVVYRPIIDMHRRWSKEVSAVARSYPALDVLLG